MVEMMDWIMLCLAALLIGMSKTGIQGISLLAVPIMALTFGAKPSTGLILPMLCVADLIAVLYYRRIAEWKYVFKLLPSALVGFGVALLVDSFIPPEAFRYLLGICLAVVFGVMLWFEWRKSDTTPTYWWYGPAFGLLGGFTTMIGNAAGPVMAIYLLSVRLPKYSFVGTNAWFFLVINYLKIPVQVLSWNNITLHFLWLDACTIPFIIVGGYLGILLVKKIPEKGFRYLTTVITGLSILLLLV